MTRNALVCLTGSRGPNQWSWHHRYVTLPWPVRPDDVFALCQQLDKQIGYDVIIVSMTWLEPEPQPVRAPWWRRLTWWCRSATMNHADNSR